MSLILSCGHEISPGGNQYSVDIKSYTREGRRAVRYMTICDECLINARILDEILDTKEEIDEYLED